MPVPCPSCNKFPSLEFQEPEVDSLDITLDDGTANISYSIVCRFNSECCGEEMRELYFDGEVDVQIDGHDGDDCELSIEGDADSVEDYTIKSKPQFGFTLTPIITCACGQPVELPEDFTIADKALKKDYEELN